MKPSELRKLYEGHLARYLHRDNPTIQMVIERALDTTLKQVGGLWIECSEEMPGTQVVMFWGRKFEPESIPGFGTYAYQREEWTDAIDGSRWAKEDISHWRELPEHP